MNVWTPCYPPFVHTWIDSDPRVRCNRWQYKRLRRRGHQDSALESPFLRTHERLGLTVFAFAAANRGIHVAKRNHPNT